MIRLHPLLLCISAATVLSGCVTTQGPASEGQPNVLNSLGDLFDSTGMEFRKLVDAGKTDEARSYFNQNKIYFEKKYIKEKKPLTKELVALGKWHYGNTYEKDVNVILSGLKDVRSPTGSESWVQISTLLDKAKNSIDGINRDDLLNISGEGAEGYSALAAEVKRVKDIFAANKSAALASTYDEVILSGKVPQSYPGGGFANLDYLTSTPFQDQLFARISGASDEAMRDELFKKYADVLSGDTRTRVIKESIIGKARERFLADGRIDLDELSEIQALGKQHGALTEFANAVKVGYVDLTATSFRDRNVFDYEIAFNQDYSIELSDAKEALLSGSLSAYDYVFVTDLSAAKIFREFKSKREQIGKTQTGTRQDPNPEYVQATTDYQRAMANLQSTQINNAVQGAKPCYGWGCVVGGLLRGASEGISSSTVKEKAAKLANTPQHLTVPVYSQYSYQLVDVNVSKVARVDYYVVDVKKKQIHANYFETKDHEKFTISYNVSDNDPDRDSILRNNQKEDDVTAWEKKPLSINISTLFDPKNIATAEKTKLTTVEAFLKPLTTRKYASAKPTYGSGSEPQTFTKGSFVSTSSTASAGTSTIADERFDSVVIIKNANSIGAGFYVTPDLVLTAHHVVNKANLVEMTFYDGTKTYGKVIDHDIRLDLAIVKAQTVGKPVKIHSGPIRLGETAEAIGHPKGYEFTITRGVVSAVRKQQSQVIKSIAPVEFIQTDTPISPGNSGGPLFLKDTVIGVNDWVRVDKASQNLNFSVSFNEIRNYLNRFEGNTR
jgi:S1-C subfamily serine protease